MIRINLLPPEIIGKRKTEQRLAYIILAFIVVGLGLGGFWVFVRAGVNKSAREVATLEQRLENVTVEADSYRVFEEKQADVQRRQSLADQVLVGSIAWKRLCEELSLVLPPEVWFRNLTLDEASGLSASGSALDVPDDVPDQGHKAVARMLVRLADLEQLYDVWISGSVRTGEPVEGFNEGTVDFTVSALVAPTGAASVAATSEPAPPDPSATQ